MLNNNSLLYGLLEGQQIGSYHLQTLLGEGGFGGVFRVNRK